MSFKLSQRRKMHRKDRSLNVYCHEKHIFAREKTIKLTGIGVEISIVMFQSRYGKQNNARLEYPQCIRDLSALSSVFATTKCFRTLYKSVCQQTSWHDL